MKVIAYATHESVETLLSVGICTSAKKAQLHSCWNLEPH